MYGIVNNAVRDLIVEKFGNDKWEAVQARSGIAIDFFSSNEPYDDEITYRLAAAASIELELSIDTIMIALGEWWVLRTGREKYGMMLTASGTTLKEFLVNLPEFHNRVILIYPKLSPPEFRISHLEEGSLHLHYMSKRQGLREFVRGLLQGLGELYATPIKIEHLSGSTEGKTHEVFKVIWYW